MQRSTIIVALSTISLPMTALVGSVRAQTGLGTVATLSGKVSGVFENGVTYYKGVPYARPPVGSLRWAAPEDPLPWTGVHASDTYAPMCPQLLSTTDLWGPEFYYDWFELMWSEWVINYDLAHQVTLAQNFQRTSREWTDRSWRYLDHKRRVVIEWLKWQQMRVKALGPWRIGIAGRCHFSRRHERGANA